MDSSKTLRVRMHPTLNELRGEGGINTVVRQMYKHAADANIEFVDSTEEADLIAVHAGATYAIRGKPVVALNHGLYWNDPDNLYTANESWENEAVIESLREAMAVSVPSEWVADVIARGMHMRPRVIPHGIDLAEWQHDHEHQPYALWNKGRCYDACDPKWVGILANAYPDYNFVTTFAPTERKGNEAYRPKHGNVGVTGVLPFEQMKTVVQKSSIYLSTTRETFGIGMLEALASGVPVLAFDNGGARQIVQHKNNGYLAKDEADLIAGMGWLIENGSQLRTACRDSVLGYNWTVSLHMYRELFEEALLNWQRFQRGGIAVIIPCYNRADTLGRTIESVLAQTRSAKEIIVVDNNSTDNTREVAEWYAPVGVQYINEKKQGVGHARNAGIAHAKNEFICCVDSDDAIAPDMLKVTVAALMDDPTLGVAYTRIRAFTPDGKDAVTEWPPEYNFENFMYRRNQVPTCCMFRKTMWQRLGGYRQRYGPKGAGAEDAEFFLRAGAYGWRAARVTEEPLFHYHMNIGITSLPEYQEVNWRYYHPWIVDGRHPFASLAKPEMYSHPVSHTDDPYVSVIIPCAANHVDFLWDALDSVEGQTVRNWQVVLVLDMPDTARADRIAAAYPFVKIVQGQQKGAGAARNFGVKFAQADRLLFLDADDYLHPDALTKMLSALEDYDAVVYTDYIGHLYLDDAVARDATHERRLIARDERDGYSHVLYHAAEFDCEKAARQPDEDDKYLWCLVSSLIRKEWHERIGGFDESMPSWEDWLYWLRMAWSGICFYHLPEPLMEYRFHTGERRESGRQLEDGLLHYLQRIKKEAVLMPCGSCGKARQAPAPTFLANTFSQGVPMATLADSVTVRLNDGNIGTHRIVGSETKIDYGYRSHGDEFLMAPADYQAKRDVLLLVDTPKPEPVAEKTVEKAAEKTAVASDDSGAQQIALIDGISVSALDSLYRAGIRTVGDARFAGRDALLALDRVGEKTVDLILGSS